MANTTTRLTDEAHAFLTERHLAMLTTLRADGSPHVVAVGFTFDPNTHIARVITNGGSQKAVNAQRGAVAVLSQVDGARWLSLERSEERRVGKEGRCRGGTEQGKEEGDRKRDAVAKREDPDAQ